jgi:hypothetical protein
LVDTPIGCGERPKQFGGSGKELVWTGKLPPWKTKDCGSPERGCGERPKACGETGKSLETAAKDCRNTAKL